MGRSGCRHKMRRDDPVRRRQSGPQRKGALLQQGSVDGMGGVAPGREAT